jgi:hypothetical protein
VHFGARAFKITYNVSHTSLEADKGSEMDWLLGIILGEGLKAAKLTTATLAGKETKGTVARSLEFTVRLYKLVWMEGHSVEYHSI